MDAPKYPFKPIHSLRALALALGESESLLVRLAARAGGMYRSVPQKKKNGDKRETFDAHEPLKRVQRKIVDRILAKVYFPKYLHGGVRDIVSPRSIYSNARIHGGAQYIILQDIKNFYPSISIQQVRSIFGGLCGFSDEVVGQLASLTTLEGGVPQGASTSGYLANLVFWDVEPRVVSSLEQSGFSYSRFADDITISSVREPKPEELTAVISTITGMLASKGCIQKRAKLHIRERGQSIQQAHTFQPLTVTGLSVFNPRPGLSKDERKKIRSAVHAVESLSSTGAEWTTVEPAYRRAMGRVGRLLACQHPDGVRLKARLAAVKNGHQVALLEKYKDDLEADAFVSFGTSECARLITTDRLPWLEEDSSSLPPKEHF